jgi:hypothetical protein
MMMIENQENNMGSLNNQRPKSGYRGNGLHNNYSDSKLGMNGGGSMIEDFSLE